MKKIFFLNGTPRNCSILNVNLTSYGFILNLILNEYQVWLLNYNVSSSLYKKLEVSPLGRFPQEMIVSGEN